jgi:predicted DNA-binding transcriptional regulator YafY
MRLAPARAKKASSGSRSVGWPVAFGVPVYTERGRAGGIRLLPGYRTDVTGLTVLSTGGAQEDLGLGTAARSAILKVMRAVPEPFRPAATATSQRILVDPAGWMRTAGPTGQLGVLQAAVFTDRQALLRARGMAARVQPV